MQHIIMVRKRHHQKDYPLRQVKLERSAINQAVQLYKDHQLDMVAVVVFDPTGRLKSERQRVVFKLERNCKHGNIQAQFIFTSKIAIFKCEECNDEMFITEPREEEQEFKDVYDKV